MVFEETLKEETIVKPNKAVHYGATLEAEREYNLLRLMKAYSKEIKPISKAKLIKLAIDNLIKDVEELPEEEGLEYIRSLYKEAEF